MEGPERGVGGKPSYSTFAVVISRISKNWRRFFLPVEKKWTLTPAELVRLVCEGLQSGLLSCSHKNQLLNI